MLTNVLLKNLALIRAAEINFRPGLNILTGETGSGKSIIINAINIALGDKASKSLIRKGSDSGLVELTFITDRQDIFDILKANDISENGNQITITRKISASSSISRINGETVTLDVIKQITSRLVDIHGQHDHQSLLDPARHLDIIDMFGGESVASIKNDVKKEYSHYKELRKKLLDYRMDKDAFARELSLLNHEISEIDKASLKKCEDQQLEAEFRQMSEWAKISGSLSAALMNLKSEERGAYNSLMEADSRLKDALEADPSNKSIETFISTVKDLESVADDISRDIESYLNEHTFNEERYNEIRTRLDLINHLKDRYGSSVDEILRYRDNALEKLEGYNTYESTRNTILGQSEAVKQHLNTLAHQLSAERRKSADKLVPLISDSLEKLNFLNVDFSVDFRKNDKISENGFDRAEFLISVNPGEPPLPLAKIASGGELSRVMLAIKSAIASKDEIPTLIFDEIDTGISGRTAQMVSVKLAELSREHQVICITHLPQIAAMADAHFAISKEVTDGVTISGAVELSSEESVTEVARLLSGDEVTEAALTNAAELIEKSKTYKKQK